MARAQVNTNLGQPELAQTVARPSGISAPVATYQPSAGMQLAESLASILPSLSGYVQEARQAAQDKEAARAYDTIQGMTYEEAKAAVSSGAMRETESPWYRAAFQKQFGMANAAERKRQIATDYQTTFDKENGDINAFLAGYAQEDFQQYGNSEFVLAGMREGMSGFFDAVKNGQAEYTNGRLQQQAQEQFVSVAWDKVDTAQADGADISKTVAAVALDHVKALGMTPNQADEQLLLLARQYADQGNVEAVKGILDADPHGGGSYFQRSSTGQTATQLIELARTAQSKKDRSANTRAIVDLEDLSKVGGLTSMDVEQATMLRDTGQMSDAWLENLLGVNVSGRDAATKQAIKGRITGDLMNEATKMVKTGQGSLIQDQTITDPTSGVQVTVSSDQLRHDVVQEQVEGLMAAGAPTATVAAHFASWGMGETYSPWEKILSDGPVALSNSLLTADEKGNVTVPEPALMGYNLWKEMAAQPMLRDNHMKNDKSAAIYRDAEILEKYGLLTPEQALITAATPQVTGGGMTTKFDAREFYSALDNIETDGGWFGRDAINPGEARAATEELARIYVSRGMPTVAATEKAVEDTNRTFTVINGVMINTRNMFLPGNFGDIATAYVQDFSKSNGMDPEDVYLMPDSSGKYFNYVSKYGVPLKGAKPVTISAIQSHPSVGNSREKVNAEITKP